MKRAIFLLILFAGFVTEALSQNPVLSIRLNVADNAGGAQDLFFGLDKNATNGLDAGLGENELPPFPPTGVFEARFIGNDIGIPALGLGTYRDYRTGDLSYNGTDDPRNKISSEYCRQFREDKLVLSQRRYRRAAGFVRRRGR